MISKALIKEFQNVVGKQNVMTDEAPHPCPYPTETRLDLIGDTQPAGRVDLTVNLRQVTFGQENLPGHTRTGFGDKPGNANVFALQFNSPKK